MSYPYEINLEFYKGSPFTDAFLLEADDVAEDVTGQVLRMQVREVTDGAVKATWTSTDGQLEIGDGVESTFGFNLEASDIADLSTELALIYDIFADDDVLAVGVILITPNVTELAQ